MNESEAVKKICATMSYQCDTVGKVFCHGSQCAVWDSYEYEHIVNCKVDETPDDDWTVEKTTTYGRIKPKDNELTKYFYSVSRKGEGVCGLITKDMDS